MIKIKSIDEINKIRKAGRLSYDILEMISRHVKPGVSTQELNDICEEFTKKHGAISAPLNYHGFPRSICTSINNVVCHGIPSIDEILKEGDIVNLDITPILDGYHGDTSKTFIVGENCPKEVVELVERTKKAMEIGIKAVKPGGFFCDIGNAIDLYIREYGYGIVRDLGGHGIGKEFHEEPFVHHYKQKKKERPQDKGRYGFYYRTDDQYGKL